MDHKLEEWQTVSGCFLLFERGLLGGMVTLHVTERTRLHEAEEKLANSWHASESFTGQPKDTNIRREAAPPFDSLFVLGVVIASSQCTTDPADGYILVSARKEGRKEESEERQKERRK
jgi:hypothetical protein